MEQNSKIIIEKFSQTLEKFIKNSNKKFCKNSRKNWTKFENN